MVSLNINNFYNLSRFFHKDIFKTKDEIWQSLEKIEKYLNNWFKTNKQNRLNGKIHSQATLVGENIYIGKNTVVEPGAFINGPAYIGNNCQVRHGAYIRKNAIVGNNCVIGNSTEIKNSILIGNVRAAHFNYIGDSILGNNVNLGAGVKIANFRLDKKTIKLKHKNLKINTSLNKFGAIIGDDSMIGCNTVINPGTVIEKNCKIFPLLSVSGHIKPGLIKKQ
ncbi:DapH/DapD/GlmU-related protein [Patescibacteria group bacterium]